MNHARKGGQLVHDFLQHNLPSVFVSHASRRHHIKQFLQGHSWQQVSHAKYDPPWAVGRKEMMTNGTLFRHN